MKRIITRIGLLLAFMLISPKAYSVDPLESQNPDIIARLLREHPRESRRWLEGFLRPTGGTQITYQWHHPGLFNCRIARATDGKDEISWLTAPVPRDLRRRPVTFVWSAGIGANLAEKEFTLFVNDIPRFTLTSSPKQEWTVSGEKGSSVTFTTIREDKFADFYGYMKMTIPYRWVVPGKTQRLKIVGEAANNDAWIATYEDTAAAAYFRQNIYPEITYHNFDAVTLKLFARPGWAGKEITLYSERKKIGESSLAKEENLAVASFYFPRHEQGPLKNKLNAYVRSEPIESLPLADLDKERIEQFLDEKISFERWVFPVGDFPKVRWSHPERVEGELGKFDLEVAYYDAKMNPVEKAENPGRYGAVVSATTPAGYTIRRYHTLFCTPEDFRWDRDHKGGTKTMDISVEPFASFGISQETWRRQQEAIDTYYAWRLLNSTPYSSSDAIFLAGLNEMGTNQALPAYMYHFHPLEVRQRFTDYLNRQWWVTFQRKELGIENLYPAFEKPRKLIGKEAPVLREGDPSSVGYREEDIEQIRQICREWAKDSDEPLVALVARRGVVILHEPFGNKEDGTPMDTETPTWMASISKLMAGVMMMEFVDQGLIDLDDPVKKYLPEFDQKVERDLTVRHLFTHTAGFSGHRWDGDPAAVNSLAHYLPYLEVGKRKEYTGVGNGLAGHIMERVSGRTLPYLYQEQLFQPLGAENALIAGTYGDMNSLALDMAKLGQMLLNRGKYGEYEFFSEETFEKMLPTDLSKFIPGIEQEWGIGCIWSREEALSERAFGHGAASGAILQIDPENELVIVSCRHRRNENYKEYAPRFFEACAAPFHR